MAAVNVGNTDKQVSIAFPGDWGKASLYVYNEAHPVPVKSETTVKKSHRMTIPAQSFVLMTSMIQ